MVGLEKAFGLFSFAEWIGRSQGDYTAAGREGWELTIRPLSTHPEGT